MAKKQIIYNIGFNVDSSELQKLKNELAQLEKMGRGDLLRIDPNLKGKEAEVTSILNKIHSSANEVQNALTAAFNPRLNTINLDTFQKHLANVGKTSIPEIGKAFQSAGIQGQIAFSNLTQTLTTIQPVVKKTSQMVDKLAESFANTVRWSVTSGIINSFSGSLQKAWGYAEKLDTSLNDIRIVTEKSSAEMDKFAKSANKAAKNLGASTTSYTNAALIYYQQGLSEKEVEARTKVTLKAANVTGQSAAEVSEQLTAVWNGYKVVAEEAELYVDKLAAVAATTAADLEELSTGMSKVASAANAMGVDVDQLSAQLATIVSVTRQDANVVGTALKTIYSRMGDLKVDGVDEFGTSLGDVSGQLQQMGIDVLDQQGNLRDMGSVIEEVAKKWGTWTDAQQQAAAVAIAGKRQYNNLIALFENWDMYEGALATSKGAEGTLQKQQDIYMDSLEARLQKLSTAGERVYDALIDSDSMKTFIDLLTQVVDGFGSFIEAIGGGGVALQALGGIATKVFSKNIAQGISRIAENFQIGKINSINEQALRSLSVQFGMTEAVTKEQKQAVTLKEEQLKFSKFLTEEEKQYYDLLIKETLELDRQKLQNKATAQSLHTRAKTYKQRSLEEQFQNSNEKVNSLSRERADIDKAVKEQTKKVNKATQAKDTIHKEHPKYIPNSTLGRQIIAIDNKATEEQNKLTSLLEKQAKIIEKQNNALKEQQEIKTQIEALDKQILSYEEQRATYEEHHKASASLQMKGSQQASVFLAENVISQGDLKAIKGGKADDGKVKEANDKLLQQKQAIAWLNQIQETNIGITDDAKDKIAELTLSYDKYIKQVSSAENATKLEYETQNQLRNLFAQVVHVLEDNTGSYTDFIEQLDLSKEKAEELKRILGNLGEAHDDLKKKMTFEETVSQISNLIGNITMLASAASSIKNIGSIWSDEDLSQSEKIEQTIQSTAMSLGMLMPIIKSFSSLIQIENKKLVLSFKSILGIAGLVITAVEIISSIVEAINSSKAPVETQYEKLSKALSKATEVAKEAREEFSRLKKELSTITSEMESLSTLETTFSKMKEGSEEWRKSLEEINFQVLELVNTYPQLAEFLKTKEVGVGSIQYYLDEGAWDALIKEQRKKLNDQYKVSAYATLRESQLKEQKLQFNNQDQLNSVLRTYANEVGLDYNVDTNKLSTTNDDLTNLSKDEFFKDFFDEGGVKIKLDTATLNEESLAEFNEKIQALDVGHETKELLNGIHQALAENTRSLNASKRESQNARFAYERAIALSMGFSEEEADIYANIGKYQPNIDTSEVSRNVGFVGGASEHSVNESSYIDTGLTAVLAAGTAYGAKAFLSIPEVGASKVAAGILALASALFTAQSVYETDKHKKDALNNLKNNLKSNLWGQYQTELRALGYSINDISFDGIDVSDWKSSNIESQFKVKLKGQEYSWTELQTLIGEQRAELQAKEYQKATAGYLTAAKEKGASGFGAYFQTVVNEDGEENNLANDPILKAREEWLNTEGSIAELDSIIENAIDITDEEGNVISYGKTTKLNASQSKAEFVRDLKNMFGFHSNFFTGKGKKVSAENWKGLDYFNDDPQKAPWFLELMGLDLNSNQFAKMVDGLLTTDFSSISSVNQFRALLVDLGVDITGIGDNWDSFIANLSSGANAWINSSDTVIKNLTTIKQLLSALKVGDIISDEDYQKLTSISPELSEYFVKTAEGWSALANGSFLETSAKVPYQNLTDVQTHFSAIDTFANTNHGHEYGTSLDFNTKSDDELRDYLQGFADAKDDTTKNFLAALNIDLSDLAGMSVAQMKLYANKINQALVDAELGNYNFNSAVQTWGTSVATGWDQVRGNEKVTGDNREKLVEYWGGKYLSELGIESTEFFNLTEANVDKLQDAAIALRKSEINQIEELERAIDKAVGQDKVDKISQLSSEYGAIADAAFGAYKEMAKGLDSGNFEALNSSSSQADIEAYLASLDPTDENNKNKINYLESLLKMFDLWQENIDAALDSKIEAFNTKIQIRLDFEKAERDWEEWTNENSFSVRAGIDFFMEKGATETANDLIELLDNDIKAVTSAFGNLSDFANLDFQHSQFEIVPINRFQNEDGVNSFKYVDQNGKFFYNEAEYKAAIESALETGKEAYEQLKDTLTSLYDTYFDAQEELMGLYDKQIEKLNSINSLYRAGADLAQIVGKNTSGYFASIVTNTSAAYDLAVEKQAAAKAEYDKAVTNGNADMIATTEANLVAATEEMTTALQDRLAALAEFYGAKLSEAINDAAGGDLAAISEQWSLEMAKEDRALDEVEETYSREELNRKIQASIDETDNIAAQNKLNEMRIKQEEKLNLIKAERGKLSQYDLDRANAEYELTLKKIALEEAQQTANKMKLTRDAMGNYTYQYVADQDTIAKAEEELAAAEKALYDMDKERNKSLVDEYYSTMTEANTAIAEAMAAGDEERVARLKEYYFGTNGLLQTIQNEIGGAAGNLQEIGNLMSDGKFTSGMKAYTDAIANMELDKLAANLDTLLGTGTEENPGWLKGFLDLKDSINIMLGEEGALTTVTATLNRTVEKADVLKGEVAALQGTTDKIIANIKILAPALESYAKELKSYSEAYLDYAGSEAGSEETELVKALKAQNKAITDNTLAVLRNTDMLDDKLDGAVNGREIQATGFKFDKDWLVIDENT